MTAERTGTVLLGSDGAFTRQVLAALVAAGIPPTAVVIPETAPARRTDGSPIPVLTDGSIEADAARNGVELVRSADVNACAGIARLRALEPGVLLIACHPRRLREAALEVASRCVLNVHPSLLPRYRGIAPVFWQLRAGERRVGVTVHRATTELDAGPVIAQREVEAPAGIRGSELESRLARIGGELASQVITATASGEVPPGRPQDRRAASAQPRPRAADFELSLLWTTERAYRFIEGTREWGVAHRLRCESRMVEIRRAVGFSAAREENMRPTGRGTVLIPFSDGALEVVLAP